MFVPKDQPVMSIPFVRLMVPAGFMILCGVSGSAQAGDLEDCNGPVPAKIESGCTAIINDQSRVAEDRLHAYVNRSRLFMGRSNLDAGLADAEAAVALNPKSVAALLSRGFARQRKGNFDGALTDINQAIELDPKSPNAFAARGGLKIDQKQWTDAAADFTQAISLRQDYALAYVGRARVYVETSQLDQAMSDLNTAISMNANLPNAFFLRGQVYRRKGRHRSRDRGFFAGDRADTAARSRLLFRAGTAVQLQGRLCACDRGFRQGAVDRSERPVCPATAASRRRDAGRACESARRGDACTCRAQGGRRSAVTRDPAGNGAAGDDTAGDPPESDKFGLTDP